MGQPESADDESELTGVEIAARSLTDHVRAIRMEYQDHRVLRLVQDDLSSILQAAEFLHKVERGTTTDMLKLLELSGDKAAAIEMLKRSKKALGG